MQRVAEIIPAGQWKEADVVVLDADERHRRRTVLTGERGTTFLLDLPSAAALKDGDGLVLDDGSIVRIAGKPEALVEVAAGVPASWRGSPGTSAIATPTCRFWANGCASAATTCWRTCCAASVRA